MRVRFTETVGAGLRKMFSRQRLTSTIKKSGDAVSVFLRKHYEKKDKAEPNRLGGDRTHFWRQIGSSVQPAEVKGGSVSIRITDRRFPQKLYGGPIVPKRAKALTIPIHPAAHGRGARELGPKVGGLFILRSKGGAAFLAGKLGGRLTLYYILLKRVFQHPWPGTLPPARSMKWVFTRTFRMTLKANLKKQTK